MTEVTISPPDQPRESPPTPPPPGTAGRRWTAALEWIGAQWTGATTALRETRFELAWIAYGLALLGLSTFNDYHGLVLSLKLPVLGLDLGLLYVAAGAFLALTRQRDSAPSNSGGPDWLARAGAALLVFGVGSEILSQVTGTFSNLVAAGVFLPDLATLVGGALFVLRISWPVLPRGPIFSASLFLLGLGTLATLVYQVAARLPYHELYQAYLQGEGRATLLAAAAAGFNPAAPVVGSGQGALELLRLARTQGIGLTGPHPLLAWLPAITPLGLVGLVWAAVRRAPATASGERSLWAAAIVIAAGVLLYLPTLGGYAFFDPWEGHYAEVARQMVARDDWISLFWGDNWFWSKPVGIFWMMATSFEVFGVSDFAARLPFALTGIAGIYFAYYFCRKLWSTRAGVIAAVVLACLPQYLFISRQVMTDAPVAVMMMMGTGLLILALFAREEDEIERRPLTLLFMTVFAATTLPQYGMLAGELQRFGVLHAVIYLAVWAGLFLAISRGRKARQIYAYGFYLCIGLGCLAKGLLAPGLPAIVLVVYLLATGDWGDAFRPRRLGLGALTAVVTFGLAVAIAKLGFRVPPAAFGNLLVSLLVVSVAVGIFAIALTARGGVWDRLEVRKGLLIFALVALPWYVAMSARHGGTILDANAWGGFRFTGFLQEFIVQHHFNRIGGGIHGDTGTTFEYFFRWGAYAAFPWVAFVPAALGRFWRGASPGASLRQANAGLFVFLWFAVFFTIFTLSATKFHHYILPALPPLAIMIGVWLDRSADRENGISRAALVGGIFILAFVARDLIKDPQIFFNSFTYVFSGRSYPWPTTVMPEPFLKLLLVGLVGVLGIALWPRRPSPALRRSLAVFWGLVLLGLAVAAVLWHASPVAPKLVSAPVQELAKHREALAEAVPMPPANLVTEYVKFLPHDRFWAYTGKITGRLGDYGFGAVGLLVLLLAVMSIFFLGRRRAGLAAFAGLTLIFGLWAAHAYMVQLGPHSGQRDMFEIYNAQRKSPREKICAYMMNWRSEHWYTKNQVVVALNDTNLLKHARQPGRQWVITERSRLGTVRNLINHRNRICRKVSEWNRFSNRYVLLSLDDDPTDPQVQACRARP